MNLNTFDRLIHYFQALATQPFSYGGKEYKPFSKLIISPSVFSSYDCPEKCGACCKPVTLTWTEDEHKELLNNITEEQKKKLYNKTSEKQLIVNNKSVKFYTFEDYEEKFCYFLNKNTGRCTIYRNRILPGRIELFKFAIFHKKDFVIARVAKPGRGWAYKTVTGEKGVKCKMKQPYKKEIVDSYINALLDIKKLMDFFNIENDVIEVVEYLKNYEIYKNIKTFVIKRNKKQGFFKEMPQKTL